jgi:putative oxidoreductase
VTRNDRLAEIALPLGRVTLASLFLLAGINKVLNYGPTLVMMREAGIEPALLLLPLTILLELGAGGLIARGRRLAAVSAIILAIYTLATNLFFHRFWELSGVVAELQLSLFFKNIAIFGALLYLAATTDRPKTNE